MTSDSGLFFFKDFFTFEMANNHQGSVEHGERIIREIGSIARNKGIRGAIKFQFRDLDSFIHPDFRESSDNKHISRFLSTKLTREDFKYLAELVKGEELHTMATPFDEKSVDLFEELDIDIMKVASCSATDWPLLERIVRVNKPIIASVGGLSLASIDNLVSFLDHRYANFAIMHCVAIYPTLPEKLELNKIQILSQRYPNLTIGFSTHEDPENYEAIQMAYAKGARIFERHVGVSTDTTKLNAYSSNPDQVGKWIDAWKRAKSSCGDTNFVSSDPQEVEDLRSLMRGVYAKRLIGAGQTLTENDVFYAIPLQKGQLTSGEFKSGTVSKIEVTERSPLMVNGIEHIPSPKEIIYRAVHEVKGMLNEAHIPINHDYVVELSHHHGISKFFEFGAVIIDVINGEEYCKKYIVQLPGQIHPHHYHIRKEEAFHILSGTLNLDLEGKIRVLYPGDIQVVRRGVRHKFWTNTGVIFEEISTTHYNDDSIYEDSSINSKVREKRKTRLINWGRHQFD